MFPSKASANSLKWGHQLSTQPLTPRRCIPHGAPAPGRLWVPCSVSSRRSSSKFSCSANKTDTESVPDVENESQNESEPGFFGKVGKVLRDFGMGRRSIWEGGVGAFILGGAVLSFWLLSWAKGSQLRKGKPYQATFEFPQACGIATGTPVRIRGVAVGSALSVKPKLDAVEVNVEVTDQSIIIPRNSIVEANQSGLIAEPFIDITPQLPVPAHKSGPLDADCAQEDTIVCNGGKLQGEQGVSLDDLVYICTKLARQMDAEGVDSMFRAADSLAEALDTARPLIRQAADLVHEITPLLRELRERGVVDNLDLLTKSVAEATQHLEELERAVLDEANVVALRDSVKTLTDTLKSIERMADDASLFTGDRRVMSSLKRLIEAMSRIMEE
ncbi:hypothetical protein BSKO_00986 [Bryopsis sp. KO-2023]|nr:hypothetical protein BSKO_00986 [Bryopsis sp. KO-2023]